MYYHHYHHHQDLVFPHGFNPQRATLVKLTPVMPFCGLSQSLHLALADYSNGGSGLHSQ